MRLLITLSFLPSLNSFCFGQTTKEQKFKTTIQEIITSFSKQDSIAISRYINKEIGVFQLDRIGVFDNYNHFQALSFSNTTYPQVLFRNPKGIKLLTLKYTSLPTWDCDKEAWSKKGLFVDTTKTDHLLSKMCKTNNKLKPDSISKKQIQFFFDLETKSRRVVLYDPNKIELVFYVSYLNGRWYLTIVDNVSSDCSV